MTTISTALMLFALAVSASTVRAQDKFEASPDARVLGDFKARVEKYDQLRKKADDSAPPMKETSSGAARSRTRSRGSPSGSAPRAPA